MPTPSLNGTASYELEPPARTKWRRASRRSSQAAFPISSRRMTAGSLGYAYAGPFRPRPAYRFIVEDSVYVAPEAKGRGIGQLAAAAS